MDVNLSDIVVELKQLRRGRGISAAQLGERIGPALRAVCNISPEENVAEIRKKVSERICNLTAPLPNETRVAVLAAFGLHEDAKDQFYQNRVHWAAIQMDRDDRTVRRRIDQGIEQVAEMAIAANLPEGAPHPKHGWHTEDLRTMLLPRQHMTEVLELRRIMVDTDRITELALAFTVTAAKKNNPTSRERLQFDVLRGGLLISQKMESADRISLVLRPPKSLRSGDFHDIALRFQADMEFSHYVCVPRSPVDRFELHTRFELPAPMEIVRLDRVFQEDARDPAIRSAFLVSDLAGEVHTEFHSPSPGFAHGIRWNSMELGGIQTH